MKNGEPAGSGSMEKVSHFRTSPAGVVRLPGWGEVTRKPMPPRAADIAPALEAETAQPTGVG